MSYVPILGPIFRPALAVHRDLGAGPLQPIGRGEGRELGRFKLSSQSEAPICSLMLSFTTFSRCVLRCLDNIFIVRLWRPLSMNASTCTLAKPGRRPSPLSGGGSPSINTNGLMPHMAGSRPPWSTSMASKPISGPQSTPGPPVCGAPNGAQTVLGWRCSWYVERGCRRAAAGIPQAVSARCFRKAGGMPPAMFGPL